MKCCLFTFVIAVIASFCVLGLWLEDRKNDRLLTGNDDAALAKELNIHGEPIIEAIYQYKLDHGEYPNDLEMLIPSYLEEKPRAIIGDRLVYNSEPYYGVPFYFGYRGNYSGSYFLHGWVIIYCPISICTVPDNGTRRIDDKWLFIHSSAF